jgi:cytochrome P450
MARLASEEVSSWPLDKVIDLGLKVRRLVRTLAVGLLFGNDRQRAFPIIELLSKALDYNWSLSVLACPIDLPFTPYGKMLRGGEALERRILEWANCVRGRPDPQNLMSIIVNNPTETGSKLTAEEIVEQMPTLIGATYETCQNAVIWTLILLVQHPRIAQELYEELHHKLAGDTATLDKIEELPLLDAVIKESMILLPPVPNQFRVAERDAKLAGYETPKGLRVLLSVFLTNREPELYYDSDRFLPRRWQTITPTPFEYSVFGGGLHGCPGFWFGLGVVKVALATILVHHRVVLLPQTINYKVRVNLSPCGPVRAVLHHHGAPFLSAALRGGLTKLVRL